MMYSLTEKKNSILGKPIVRRSPNSQCEKKGKHEVRRRCHASFHSSIYLVQIIYSVLYYVPDTELKAEVIMVNKSDIIPVLVLVESGAGSDSLENSRLCNKLSPNLAA